MHTIDPENGFANSDRLGDEQELIDDPRFKFSNETGSCLDYYAD